MELDESLDKRQPDPASDVLFLHLVEPFEYTGLLVYRYPYPCIVHLQNEVRPLDFCPDIDPPAVRIFEGVGYQIVENQFQILPIYKYSLSFQTGVEGVSDLLALGELFVV